MNESQRGLSFLTVLIIIAIIGIFFGSVIKVVDPLDRYYKIFDDQRKSDLQQIKNALEAYYKTNNQYPRSTGEDGYNCTDKYMIMDRNPNTQEIEPVRWGAKWFGNLDKLPQDPDGNRCYVYIVSPTRQSYWIYASLARDSKDPDACSAQKPCNNLVANNAIDACRRNAGDAYQCNYGLSSPNESL